MGSSRASDGKKSYKTFAWQGISLTVPSAWDLVFTKGNYEAGHVRLADPTSPRLEMRWQTGRADGSPGDTVGSYLAKLSKKARKEGTELAVQRGLKLASPVEKEVECFRWVAERQALAMLSRCRRCRRVVHLHLLGDADERLRGLARTVFASLRDHPEGETHLWQFLDVKLRSPVGLPLARAKLQAGCIRMTFSRRATRLEFVRASLAEIVLADRDLAQWFREFYRKSLKRRTFSVQAARVKGHSGLEVEGRPWRLVNPLSLVGRRRMLRAACWHCEQTNRLFICSLDGAQKEADLFEPALQGFTCCEGRREAAGAGR